MTSKQYKEISEALEKAQKDIVTSIDFWTAEFKNMVDARITSLKELQDKLK